MVEGRGDKKWGITKIALIIITIIFIIPGPIATVEAWAEIRYSAPDLTAPGSNWTNPNPQTPPMPRAGHLMAFDPTTGLVVMFGGFDSQHGFAETCTFDVAANKWGASNPSPSPSARYGHAMAYAGSGTVLLFGGTTGSGETWRYNASRGEWTNITRPTSPAARWNTAMAYDPTTGKVVLFGGGGLGPIAQDTWLYDLKSDTWSDANPPSPPPARWEHSMAYDPVTGKIILFGGDLPPPKAKYFQDTWTYDAKDNLWTNISSTLAPTSRRRSAMAYDNGTDKMIIFGGEGLSGMLGDTWLLDTQSQVWSNFKSSPSPNAREMQSMTYDSKNRKVVMFGGTLSGGSYSSETWLFSGNQGPPSPPNVLTTSPADTATNVALDATVTVNFDQVMDPVTTSAAFSIIPSVSGGSASVTANILSWNHSSKFASNTKYTVTINASAKSSKGIAMLSPYSFSFTTGNMQDTYPPYVVSTDPPDGTNNIPITSSVSINWNESMNQTSAEGAFSSTPAITCSWSWNGLMQTCTPTSLLQAFTPYSIVISTSAKDLAGNAMKDRYIFTFRTGSGGGNPPVVLDTSPLNLATNVSIFTTISITFSEAMDHAMTESAIFAAPSISGTFQWDALSKTVTWSPSADLMGFTGYLVTISTSARSQGGVNMQSTYSFRFTTGGNPGKVPPTVIWTKPLSGVMNVPVDSKIQIAFSKPMNMAVTEGAIAISPLIFWTTAWASNDSVITLSPTLNLSGSTIYYILVRISAKSADGLNMSKSYYFNFKTGPGPDMTPPYVVSTDPINESKGVDPEANMTIVFNKPMDHASVESSITLSPGSIASLGWDASDTTISIAPRLELGKSYTLTISTEAKDAVGIHFQKTFILTFTTNGTSGPNPIIPGLNIDLAILIPIILIMIIIVVVAVVAVVLAKRRHLKKCPSCNARMTKEVNLCPECGYDLIRRTRAPLEVMKPVEKGAKGQPVAVAAPVTLEKSPEEPPKEIPKTAEPPTPDEKVTPAIETSAAQPQAEEGSERRKRVLDKLQKLREARETEK